MYKARRYTAYANAATDYVSLSEAKQHLRVTSSADDTYISGLISMAVEACGAYLGYSIRKATARYGYDSFVGQPALINPVNGLTIPSGNYLRVDSRVLDVEQLYYVDDNNAIQTFDAADWIVSPDPMSNYSKNIFMESAPSSITDDSIKYIVEVTEGFNPVGTTGVDPDTICPATIKHAALLLIGQYYDNRQAITVGVSNTPLNFGLHYLLDPYKIPVMI